MHITHEYNMLLWLYFSHADSRVRRPLSCLLLSMMPQAETLTNNRLKHLLQMIYIYNCLLHSLLFTMGVQGARKEHHISRRSDWPK